MKKEDADIRTAILSQFIKAVFLIVLLVIAYLFALNGRYIKIEEDTYFDKWRCGVVWVDKRLIQK